MSLKSRLNKIKNKMPEPEFEIIVTKDPEPGPEPGPGVIIVGPPKEWLERQKKLKEMNQ